MGGGGGGYGQNLSNVSHVKRRGGLGPAYWGPPRAPEAMWC